MDMDIILKAVSEAPLVAFFAYLWWKTRQDYEKRVEFLEDRIRQKDQQTKEFTETFRNFAMTLELIKDRLR